MTFPLILLPKRIIYVDDKRSFLDALRLATPKHYARHFISSPRAGVEAIGSEKDHWRHLERLLSPADQSDAEEQVPLLQRVVDNHFCNWSRFQLTSVAVVDYSMPIMDGLEMIRALGGWPGQKVLLTGQADASVAIAAFNAGLIHKFIPKDTKDLYRVIRQAHEEMHQTVCEHFGHLLRPGLSQKQRDFFEDPRVIKGLRSKIEELEWTEYVVIGKPFGLIGIAPQGPLQWMQLECSESLVALSEMALVDGCSCTEARLISDGALISNNDLHASLGLSTRIEMVDASVISESPDMYAGVFDLPFNAWTSDDYGIDDIAAPVDEVRSLLRDVMAAASRGSQSDDFMNSQELQGVLTRLRAMVHSSKAHQQALAIAMKDVDLNADLRALLLANAELGRVFE